ncbi:MAG: response regulator [Roseiflexaceae bacterium]
MAFILVVDDQPQLLDSIQMTLELVGYRVRTAGTGIEALTILQAQPIDLILTDIEMPKLDGYQLCQRVRAERQWSAIPLLFLSAHGDEEDMRYAKSLGADGYLLKPIEPEDLLAAVHDSLLVGAGRAHL